MDSMLNKGMSRSRALRNNASITALQSKASGFSLDSASAGASSPFGDYRQQSTNRRRYGVFRGWVHAAIHALAEAAAGQPVRLGRLNTAAAQQKRGPSGRKSAFSNNQADDMEMINNHGILELLKKPNPIQYQWQYVYSFIANLSLTGVGYLVSGVSENGLPEVYSLPTTWVKPIHDKGPYMEFKIVDPSKPESESNAEILTREQVGFAHIPDPSNPMAGLPPSAAQQDSIDIDERIQSSQKVFFDNGIFPSVIVTVGKNPHPDIPGGGLRPRLSAKQRRQIYSAIKKVQAGVSNYGNPAIVDGLIERIDKVSADSNEMGWSKSEASAKKRILSAFGVHPFILGEEMVGSEAQARIVKEQFYDKVNTMLSLLSMITTDFVPGLFPQSEEGLKIWYEPKVAVNPQSEQDRWKTARSNGDVTQDEFRAWMGLPPDADLNPSHIGRSEMTAVLTVAGHVNQGVLTPGQALAILEGMGLPSDLATRIAGDSVSEEDVFNELQDAVRSLDLATRAVV